ncbi:MAG: ABC transporter permease [Chitinispirillaceae bacterium]
MKTQDISITSLILLYSLAVIPITLFYITKTPLVRKTLFALLRMTGQLLFVGLYLGFVFKLNNLALNLLWIVIMILVANFNVNSNIGIRSRTLFFISLSGLSTSTVLVGSFFIVLGISPAPLYDARYLIPICGMILGNCLRGNIIGLERFISFLKGNENEYILRLSMGASPSEAAEPFFSKSFISALAPTISNIATIGLVSLPGMMTGQILGGSAPYSAIKYQIGIMLAIFAATSLGVYINLKLCMGSMFDCYGFLKTEFRDENSSFPKTGEKSVLKQSNRFLL